MAKDFPALNAHHRDFITRQHMFFTASAAAGAHINISPRSTDYFRVTGDNSACYLDRTGSGNETAAHLVKTSCGYGVPLFEYQAERDTMDKWANAKGPEGIEAYWREKNLTSMDGLPTGMPVSQ
jgi:hypothetical protein